MLDKLSKAATIGTVFLIVLGLYNLQQKYYWYDIKIIDYLDASEILLSFSDILMTIVVTVTFAGLIMSGILGSNASNMTYLSALEHGDAFSAYLRTVNWTKVLQIMIPCTLITTLAWTTLLIYFLVNSASISNWHWIWFDGMYVVAFVTGLIASYALSRSISLPTILWSCLVSFAIFFSCRNYLSWKLKAEGIPKHEVALTFADGSMLFTSKNRLYVDQTRNYVFLMYVDTRKIEVIPMREIKRMEITQLHHGL